MAENDVERLDRVLAMCKRHGLVIGSVRVGDLSVTIMTAMPVAPPAKPRQGPPDEDELQLLRRKSKALYGRVLPDEELREQKGAL